MNLLGEVVVKGGLVSGAISGRLGRLTYPCAASVLVLALVSWFGVVFWGGHLVFSSHCLTFPFVSL